MSNEMDKVTPHPHVAEWAYKQRPHHALLPLLAMPQFVLPGPVQTFSAQVKLHVVVAVRATADALTRPTRVHDHPLLSSPRTSTTRLWHISFSRLIVARPMMSARQSPPFTHGLSGARFEVTMVGNCWLYLSLIIFKYTSASSARYSPSFPTSSSTRSHASLQSA